MVKLLSKYPSPLKKFAVAKFPKLLLLVTFKLPNVPIVVILGCAPVVNVPVNKLAPIVPLLAYTLPAVTLPVTARLVNVPTLVILG